jgi:hypothetical protein
MNLWASDTPIRGGDQEVERNQQAFGWCGEVLRVFGSAVQPAFH